MKSVALASALAASLLLGACASHSFDQQLQHQWVLVSVDGVAVPASVKSELSFADQLKVSGRAGCNRFFGPASVSDGVLKADQLGVTMMACAPDAQKVESAVLATLKQTKVEATATQLTLTGAHKLIYQQSN